MYGLVQPELCFGSAKHQFFIRYEKKFIFMRNLVLTFIILIGLYTLIRNNIFILPDQLIWSTNHDIFYKVFIPLLMIIGALVSIIKKDRINIFFLTGGAMLTDAMHRLSVAVNHFYGYILYKDIPIPPPKDGTTTFVINYWPSHIMLFIEIILVIMILRLFICMRPSIVETSS
jgi:hypothetical protein